MIHLNLIFMFGVSYGQNSLSFFHMDSQYLKQHLF